MDRMNIDQDNEETRVRLLRALERAVRLRDTTKVTVKDVDAALLVAESERKLHSRCASDCLRSARTLTTLLRDGDVVVRYHRKPLAVILTPAEYERLTGRELTDG